MGEPSSRPDAPRRALSATAERARRLLVGGLVGGHVGALGVTAAFWWGAGTEAGVSAAVAAVVTLAFSTIGQAVQVAVADADPRLVMVAALGSYVLRVSVLGLLLVVVLQNAERFAAVDSVAVAGGTIVVVLTWLAGEFRAYSRLRIPVFDPPDEM